MDAEHLVAFGGIALNLAAVLGAWLVSRKVAGKRESRLASLDADVRSMLSVLAAQRAAGKPSRRR